MKETQMVGLTFYAMTLLVPIMFLKLMWGYHWSLNLIGLSLLGFHTILWFPLLKRMSRE